MRKFLILLIAAAAQCLFTAPGHAAPVKLTSDQVKSTCGSLLVDAGSHYGCKKYCGDGKTCGFYCEKGGKNCAGEVLSKKAPSRKDPKLVNQPLKGGILDAQSSGMGGQGPAQTGRAVAPPTAPPVRLQ
jgi:hypothetical protein